MIFSGKADPSKAICFDQPHRCKQLEHLLALAPGMAYQGYFGKEGSLTLTYISLGCEQLLGIQPSALLANANLFLERLHPDDRIAFVQSIKQTQKNLNAWQWEGRYILPDGKVKWISFSAMPEAQVSGNVLWQGWLNDISHNLQVELALQKSKTRLAQLTANVPGMIYQYRQHPNGTDSFTYVSSYIRDIFGLEPETVQQSVEAVWAQIHPEDVQSLKEAIAHSAQTLNQLHWEGRIISLSGQMKWVSAASRAKQDFNGDIVWDGILTDISDRKLTEAALVASEQKYRSLYNTMNEGVVLNRIIYDETGNPIDYQVLDVNPAYEAILGISRETAIGALGSQLYGAEAPPYLNLFANVAATAAPTSFETHFEPMKRDFHICAFSPAPGQFAVVFDDITRRKANESELLRISKAVESASDAIAMADATGTPIYQNAAFTELYEYANVQEFYASGGFAAAFVDRSVANEVLETITQGDSWNGECEHRTNRDRKIQVWLRADAIKNALGHIIGFIGISTDITRRKQAETALQQLLTQLEDQVEQRTLQLQQTIAQLQEEITFRQQVETALRHAQTQLQKLASNVPGMLYQCLMRPDGEVAFPFVSSCCREICELAPHAFQQNPALLLEMMHPEDLASFDESVRQSVQTLQAWRWEGRLITPTGKIKWVQAASRPDRQENGDIVWDGLIIDITDRKLAEEGLLKQNQRSQLLAEITLKIRQSLQIEEIQQTTVEEVQQLLATDRVLIYQLLPDGSGMVVTEAVVAQHTPILGQQIEDPCFNERYIKQYRQGRIRAIANLETAEVQECHKELLRRFEVKANLVVPILQREELWGLLIAHQCTAPRQWTQFEIELLQQLANQVGIALAQAELLEQQRKTSRQLAQQNIALEQALKSLQQAQTQLVQSEKMASLGQLVAGVAHEINNPVSFIYGNIAHAERYSQELMDLIELYQHHYPDPVDEIQQTLEELDLDFLTADLKNLLQSMNVGAKRIREIVKSLRNFSRLDEAECKAVDLHEGIDNTLLILQHRLRATPEFPEIEVIKDYNELPPVRCCAGHLNQVFMNILSNAIDALEESVESNLGTQNAPKIWIRTEYIESPEGKVTIRIADNGAGMSLETQQRLFDPFFTTKSIGKGTGLGLSISHSIVVEQHGGQIKVNSERGRGTEFIVELPLDRGSKLATR